MIIRKLESPRGELTVSISYPEKDGSVWKCDVEIKDFDGSIRKLNSYGEDNFDAVMQGVKLLRINILRFNEIGRNITWLGSVDCGLDMLKHM